MLGPLAQEASERGEGTRNNIEWNWPSWKAGYWWREGGEGGPSVVQMLRFQVSFKGSRVEISPDTIR